VYQVDLNCDMGESFGHWKLGADEAMMQYISSANVAGGFHAGDPHTMHQTVRLAKEHGVALGIHSGFRDLVGFGRRYLHASPAEIRDELIYQLGALREFARYNGMPVQHVKPHGALYMMAAKDEALSRAIIEAIQTVDRGLILYAMRTSVTYDLAVAMGQRVAAEFYADRDYSRDGSIVFTRAVEHQPDPAAIAQKVLKAVIQGKVTTVDREEIDVTVDTVCVHGDTPGAPELAATIVRVLRENQVAIKPLGEIWSGRQSSGEKKGVIR
jgi:5-oxoprolinase (ATP-hydrolysing) subunit A